MRINVRSYLFRAVVLGTLFIVAAIFAVGGNEQVGRPNTDDKAAGEAKNIRSDKSLWARTLDDAPGFWTAVLAGLTLVLAGVGVGQIYYLRRTDETAGISARAAEKAAFAAERSADVARDTLIASNRAWLKVKVSAGSQPLLFGPNGVSFAVDIAVKNVGEAPALHVEPHVWMMVWRTKAGESPFDRHERYLAAVYAARGGHTMFPGDVFPEILGLEIREYGVGVPHDEVAAGLHENGSSYTSLYVGGCVSYTFTASGGGNHYTAFLREIRRKDRMPIPAKDGVRTADLELVIAGGGEGNDAT